jgi:putative hydrolase of the HAD superfamily
MITAEGALPARTKALSFDLWETLIVDDSDEPKREALGLRSKKTERRYATWEALNRFEPISLEEVTLAYDVVDAAFSRVWHEQFVTWSVAERLSTLLRGLGRSLPAAALAELVEHHERMEIEVPPDTVPGVGAALDELRDRYRLCVISDTIVTPGRNLRRLLEHHGLARYFEAFIFSDEVGRAKPHPRPFEAAATALDADLSEMLHIGDRQAKDVAGSQALGMKAVLFTGARDSDRVGTTADAVCERYVDLPRLIDRLAS